MKTRDIIQSAKRIIKDAAKHGNWYESDSMEGTYESQFLGTVFSLTPSGKFYTPFASSNVDSCKVCKGLGHTDKIEREFIGYDGKNHIEYKTCPYCMGVGSREAYEDQVFMETLESESEKLGYWVENGEGDPCDLFLCRNFISNEDLEE